MAYDKAGEPDSNSASAHSQEAAVYGIDETGAARAETQYGTDGAIRDETPDPVVEGELVVCFDESTPA